MRRSGSVVSIDLPPVQEAEVLFHIRGLTPLICDCFPERAKQEIEDKAAGVPSTKRPRKVPKERWEESIYRDPDGAKGYWFPAGAFKVACVAACTYIEGLTKVFSRGAFVIMADWVKLEVGEPKYRRDVGRNRDGGRELRYRVEFAEWATEITVSYNPAVISVAQIANLLNHAGRHVGVGNWRPQLSGNGWHGMFTVESKGS